MKLFIPKLGTVLHLAAPWTVTVYDEDRNSSLVALANLKEKQAGLWRHRRGSYSSSVAVLGTFTFPVGTLLTVDRIYIRQGGEEFDSVTFRATQYQSEKLTTLRDRSVRFWARLEEVNQMEVMLATAIPQPARRKAATRRA